MLKGNLGCVLMSFIVVKNEYFPSELSQTNGHLANVLPWLNKHAFHAVYVRPYAARASYGGCVSHQSCKLRQSKLRTLPTVQTRPQICFSFAFSSRQTKHKQVAYEPIFHWQTALIHSNLRVLNSELAWLFFCYANWKLMTSKQPIGEHLGFGETKRYRIARIKVRLFYLYLCIKHCISLSSNDELSQLLISDSLETLPIVRFSIISSRIT